MLNGKNHVRRRCQKFADFCAAVSSEVMEMCASGSVARALSGETQAHAARYNFGEMLIAAQYGSLHAVFGRIGEERHGALGALCSFPLAGEIVQTFGGEVLSRFRGFLFVCHAFCVRLSR